MIEVAIKVDVDTERGTRVGVPAMKELFLEKKVPALFLFSLGPDHTGRAIGRVFRKGFLKKVSRTNVVELYGWRTLMNGTLLPGPHIGRKHEKVLRGVMEAGFEVGIHCNDHWRWQDHVMGMSFWEIRAEFGKARDEFRRIFGKEARTAGAPGWQANGLSRQVYDGAGLLYASDSRGVSPFFPRVDGQVSRTLEIPTTLPTLDELMGRDEFPDGRIVEHYLSLLKDGLNVLTVHAEIEGMLKLPLFRELLGKCLERGVRFVRLEDVAERIWHEVEVPVCEMEMREIDGRSGLVATQVEVPA